jgi:hypothetical protein
VSEQAEVTSDGATKDEQIDYWMDRCFALLDENAALINHLNAIRKVVEAPDAD